MINILCYGDSNTWGYQSCTGLRFEYDERWPGVLQKMLGEGYHVYENGMNARTTAFEDDIEPYRNGVKEIIPALMLTEPLDIIIFMLGTNDTKHYLGLNGFTIGRGMDLLLQTTKGYFKSLDKPVPKILVISPIDLSEDIEEKPTSREFDRESVKKIPELRKWYKFFAEKENCEYMDAGEFAKPYELDGVHMTADGHACLARAIYSKINEMLE